MITYDLFYACRMRKACTPKVAVADRTATKLDMPEGGSRSHSPIFRESCDTDSTCALPKPPTCHETLLEVIKFHYASVRQRLRIP